MSKRDSFWKIPLNGEDDAFNISKTFILPAGKIIVYFDRSTWKISTHLQMEMQYFNVRY